MSQLNVGTIKDQSGSGQPDLVGVAKAFVNFDGTGTVAIREAFNVDSITDNGVGLYTVNFATELNSTTYTLAGSAKFASDNSSALASCVSLQRTPDAASLTYCKIATGYPAGAGGTAVADHLVVNIVIFTI